MQSLQNPSRRILLRGVMGLAGMAMLPGCASLMTSTATAPQALGFASVEKSLLDNVMLPPGYQYSVLHATGDALDSALPAYSNKGTEADDWSRRIGDHHDGMDFYYIDANGKSSEKETGRAVLCVNHESSADSHFMHPNGQTSNQVSGKNSPNLAIGIWVFAQSLKC